MAAEREFRNSQERKRVVDAFAIVGEFIGNMLWEVSELHGRPSPASDTILLNAAEAAALLGVSTSTLQKFQQEGRIEPVKVGSRNRYSRAELNRFALNRSEDQSVPRSQRPVQSPPSIPRSERPKGIKRKPNEADRYAARNFGLNLRALKVSGPLLQEILEIDSDQYKSWAYDGGELPPASKVKFDSWCANFVETIRNQDPTGSELLVDPKAELL